MGCRQEGCTGLCLAPQQPYSGESKALYHVMCLSLSPVVIKSLQVPVFFIPELPPLAYTGHGTSSKYTVSFWGGNG